jgi:putative endonuclease
MAMHAKDVLGKSGEQAAAEYLESCGLRILDRNWRCAAGEIDIVAAERYGPSGPGCAGWRCSG